MNFFHWRRLLRSDWILLERFSSLKSSHHPSMFGNMWFLIDQLHRNSIQITRCCKLLTPMISPYLLSRSTFICTSLFTLGSFNWGFLVLLVQEICPFRKANSGVTIKMSLVILPSSYRSTALNAAWAEKSGHRWRSRKSVSIRKIKSSSC